MTIDTNELRRLAKAATHPATKGRWMRLFGERTVYDRMEDGCRGTPVVATPTSPPDKAEAAKLDFIAAANPAAVSELLDRLEAAEKERDALRAKIAKMEQQETARRVTPTAYRWRYRGAIKWQYGELTEEVARLAKERNHEIQPLGILPGAQGEEK